MTVGTNKLRKTKSQKWLAAAIQNNFKWDLHVTEIVTKASNRLHVLLVLKRGGTLSPDLLREHLTLIRSVLESCCPILHTSLTVHLSDKIERIQSGALSIFHPKKGYGEALHHANCTQTWCAVRKNVSKKYGSLIYAWATSSHRPRWARTAVILTTD